jgi:hypothetical protein
MTCRDLGDVAMSGRFSGVVIFSTGALLMRIRAVLVGSAMADGRISATMPASPP